MQLPNETSQRSQIPWKPILTGAAALFLGLGALFIVGLFSRILAVVFLGITIAAALSPLVHLLERRLPRTLAIVVVYLGILLVIGGLIAVVIPALVNQAQELINNVPELVDRAEQWIEAQPGISNESLFDTLASQIQNVGSVLIQLPTAIFSALLDITLIFTISLYTLLETEKIRQFGLSLFSDQQRDRVNDVVVEMLQAAGGFVRGIALNMVIVGSIAFIGYSLIGVPFALVLAILAGLFEVLPIVGPLLAAIPAIGVALLQSPTTALITAMFVLVVQQIEGNFLTPNIMRGQAKLSPLIVLIAVFAGGAVGGIIGALVSIPLAAALRILVIRVIAPLIRQQGTPSSPG